MRGTKGEMMDEDLRGLWDILRSGGIERFAWEARQIAAVGKTEKEQTFMAWRRAAGEPLPYVLGEWDFYGYRFFLSADTLIPRPDTETLVDKALALLQERGDRGDILDLCCGSGCIGLAIARTLPDTRVTLADISEGALETAGENAAGTDNAVVISGDALQDPPEALWGAFDLLLCNPPYIAADEWDDLPSSVRDYEPRLALYGGEDGLDFYRAVTSRWGKTLRSGGILLFEIGYRQAEDVRRLMEENGFGNIKTIQDIAQRDRVVIGTKE